MEIKRIDGSIIITENEFIVWLWEQKWLYIDCKHYFSLSIKNNSKW
jgi:hypothetical protein